VRRFRKLVLIALPATLAAMLLMALLIEGWVRLSWDDKRGTPGFLVSHPIRGQRLGFNYQGWFAGVPVRTNSLGFRSEREDAIARKPNTFRILVLGDSVTFGHGAVHDYPSLLETQLKQWRPEVDWQVWNLGVPGYNTSQELSYLLEVAPRYAPDLVIVGFFINDIIGNQPAPSPSTLRNAASGALSFLQQHVYSMEFYKRVALTAAWRLSGSDDYRRRFENLESEERMSATLSEVEAAQQQAITPFERFSDTEVAAMRCVGGMPPSAKDLAELQSQPDWPAFVNAVRAFQDLDRKRAYRIMFFLNLIPPVCPDGDYFYDGKSIEHEYFVKLFSESGTPTVSAYPAFLHVRPSQMPRAEAHAIGNANQLKAEAVFKQLQQRLAAELPAAPNEVR
jgi:lysophospholipase L1-like esterase